MSYNIEREQVGSMKEQLFETLAKRIGHENLEKRLKIQNVKTAFSFLSTINKKQSTM